MKQTRQSVQASTGQYSNLGKHRNRHEMNRFLRRSLIFLLLLLMVTIILAGYASLFPVNFTWNTPVIKYQRNSQIDYQVLVQPNDFTDQTVLGMDQVYLRDFTEAVNASFQYRYLADRATDLDYTYWIDTTVRVHDAANPSTVLLTRTVEKQPEVAGKIQGSEFKLDQVIKLNLADYESVVSEFSAQSQMPVSFDLAVVLHISLSTFLPTGPVQLTDAPTMLIPLDVDQFQITRLLPESRMIEIRQPLRYQMVMTQVPFPVYPSIAGICLLLIILVLLTTRSRRKSRFNRQLRRMLRQARSRLMIIGDKAWEPEWCVKVNDFRSLVRTAKKLKHPIFCYIDRLSDLPAAYFYIYFGENNYCYTLTGQDKGQARPDPQDHPDSSGPDGGLPVQELDSQIPLLPENDDGPEIMLARLKLHAEPDH